MVTYPSTHGVFEATIKDICALVHAHGGQVYMDGANLNALVGIARPAELGADVCHMNLHKTFCIPHGGGGPGMGPIGVKAHLAPFLPDHPVVTGVNPYDGEHSVGAVSAAPWGSRLDPADLLGLHRHDGRPRPDPRHRRSRSSTPTTSPRRLAPHYPVVYTGQNGMVAHECIVDIRGIKEATGITAEDVAKRLVDYGFHAPTMSWPVPETMMIEPTESESQAELDRFCEAMIAIREEIRAIEQGRADRAGQPPQARPPHRRPAARRLDPPLPQGAGLLPDRRPPRTTSTGRRWRRVDNVYGDRHLVCSCPPLEAYQQAAE